MLSHESFHSPNPASLQPQSYVDSQSQLVAMRGHKKLREELCTGGSRTAARSAKKCASFCDERNSKKTTAVTRVRQHAESSGVESVQKDALTRPRASPRKRN